MCSICTLHNIVACLMCFYRGLNIYIYIYNCNFTFIYLHKFFVCLIRRFVWLKISTSILRTAKLTEYNICDSLAILRFTFHRKLRRYGGGAAATEKFCSGKHTENHLNRKCKDNESMIQYASIVPAKNRGTIFTCKTVKSPFSSGRIPSAIEIASSDRYSIRNYHSFE